MKRKWRIQAFGERDPHTPRLSYDEQMKLADDAQREREKKFRRDLEQYPPHEKTP